MSTLTRDQVVGTAVARVDGPWKVTGTARYAYEQDLDDPLYLWPLLATVARGQALEIRTADALAIDESVRVITHENAMRLPDGIPPDLQVLQDPGVRYRGEYVAAVLARTPEIARQAADVIEVSYDVAGHDTELRADHPRLYRPGKINGGYDPDTAHGDVDRELRLAAAQVNSTYRTPIEFHVAMEPQTVIVTWNLRDGHAQVVVYDSTQGAAFMRMMLAPALGLTEDQLEVISPYVGGAFGAKTLPRPYHMLAAISASTVPGRPVRFALARQHTFSGTTFRPALIQRVALGADTSGRLTAIRHDVVGQSAAYDEFAEQAAMVSRVLYAATARATSHRLVPLDMSVPGSMRAPGRAPGAFALECALDELAAQLGLDPVTLRLRNEPDRDPATGRPFSSRELIWCLTEGARRFGWPDRPRAPRATRRGRWLVGTGVAAATYPGQVFPPSTARVRAILDGRFRVEIAASDIGTGAWTMLTQVAADALDVDASRVEVALGTSSLPWAMTAAGSGATTAWTEAVLQAIDAFRQTHGVHAPPGAEVTVTAVPRPEWAEVAMHAFGAQFAEAAVHADTGEIRVTRLFGAFDVGRILNPATARSQLIGGMVMGLSMALHEDGVVDHRYGHVVTNDLASYHIASHADVGDVDVVWLGAPDPCYNALGAKGLGEIGIVGVPAAIANAVWHATSIRVRSLPITVDKLLGATLVISDLTEGQT